jgi:hypothetical protein
MEGREIDIQYGRRRSHRVCRFRQVKQSSAAPVAAVLLLLLRGVVVWLALAVAVVVSATWAVVDDDMVAPSNTIELIYEGANNNFSRLKNREGGSSFVQWATGVEVSGRSIYGEHR